MKKILLLLTVGGVILFAGCGNHDEPQEPILDHPAIDITCICEAIYHLEYQMENLLEVSRNAEAAPSFKEYPSGQSPMWTLTLNGEAYPFTTYKEGDLMEGYCKWTCSCGNVIIASEKAFAIQEDFEIKIKLPTEDTVYMKPPMH
ncbi:MAG: hypothetical protein MJZ17_08820 [Bacteroidales bacterium]|nr:hypothetical protein [Bacteroidales bacterium]